ncbi:MAG TPA: YqaJ viral recombinase family protein [Gallicola sp.]|nr:YqaJ viral recombinase family protein [Gallicola sp.]
MNSHEEAFNRIKYTTKKEWLKKRINGIGGSDASCLVGLNNYKTIIDLWKEKVSGVYTELKFKNQKAIDYGNKAEKPLRDLFAITYEDRYKVRHTNELLQNKEYPFMLGSLDGEIIELATGRKGIYEGKTAMIQNSQQYQVWKNGVPYNYLIQVLWYLLITDFDFAIINAELRFTNSDSKANPEFSFTRRIYRVERSEFEDDIETLKQEAIKFWSFVVSKKEPPLKIASF